MSLTKQQINTVNSFLDNMNEELNKVISGRDTAYALLRFHESVSETDALQILADAKARALIAAQAVVALLS